MQKLDPKTDGQTKNIVAENIEKLKDLFPEAFTEGKVDFEVLKEIIGEFTDDREERYSFNWNGKSKARMLAQTPSTGTLRPCPEESVNWDTTQNLFIEGDNLEALKLLQKSYHKKVKMIYIDPPYNTGKEFIYPDKFQDNLDTYLRYTGQIDDEGFKMSANAETSGRYHTNWLNMMYPRLRLSRNLLRDDGVIFISIDDNEVTNLKKLCDEAFGEENFVAQISVQSNPRGRQSDTFVASVHDYIMIYAKNINFADLNGSPLTDEQRAEFKYTDDTGEPYRLLGLRQRGSASRREDRPDMFFPIYVNPNSKDVSLEERTGWDVVYPKKSDGVDGRWMWGKEKCNKDLKFLVAKMIEKRSEHDLFVKDYLNRGDAERTRKYKSIWDGKEYNNQAGTQEVKALLGCDAMSFPKPKDLLKDLCQMGLSSNDIILDFFSGSATTAHAVLDLNHKDGSTHRFIMVQLPEPCDKQSEAFKNKLKNIADIGKERIRRVINKIKGEDPAYQGDLGFKVFKLDSTNIKPWEADFDNIERTIDDYISNIKHGRTEHDILHEILLKYGLNLTIPVEERSIDSRKVFVVGMGALVICLANDISLKTAEGIALLKKELQPELMRVVFKDTGFKDDVIKTNAMQILRQNGIDDVKSL